MSTKTLEERLDSLEEKNSKLEHRLEREQAYIEIQNLMSRYEYWHTAGMNDRKGEFVAQKTPGSRMEFINSGVCEGADGAMKFMVDLHKHSSTSGQNRNGRLTVHPLTTPIIEVAGDGKTARGLWLSPGIETHYVEGKPLPCWAWETYAADFIKEDGKWKWWRIHLFRAFITPFDKSWTDIDVAEFYKSLGRSPDSYPDYLKPDRPTTYHKMFSLNDTCCWTEGVPPAPEPYETWDESMACIEKVK